MSARLERQRRRRRRGGAARVIIITITVLIACMVIGVLSAVGYVVGIANSAPDLASLRPQDPGRNSVVYAADGQKLGTIANDVLRTPIVSKSMPQNVRDATVAIEDQRFYQHKGVDFEGVIRAALKNATSGKTVQGGSTLTMQLIRNIYISGERTFQRKVREAKLAEELENVHPGRAGKEWVLTKYLNSVPYGTNGGQTAVGIQAAARAFFNKPASQLNLQEAALLAGLPQAPSAYNPYSEPARAIARRNDVLRKMQEEGYISAGAAKDAIGAPLNLQSNGYFQQKRESYFFDYVTDELIKEYGIKTVRSGGLKIKTTIDLDLQKKARAAIAKSLNFPGAPSSAIVSIDPANGYIRTMASSAKYKDSKFNLAADAKRQPGSSFKVMALVAAVNAGVNPAATSYPSGRFKQFVPKWGDIDVNCYGGRCSGGSKNLIAATLTSDNTVYIRLALDLGPAKVKAAARGLGITSKLEGVPAETLGGLARCCSPLEMADAYATIASGGWRNKPKAITEVRFPDGKVDDLSRPIRHKAFDSAAMYEVTKILAAEHQERDRHAREHRLPRGRQDRHDRQEPERLVRRLHAEARDVDLGRLPEGQHRDAQPLPRRARRRRHLPGRDLGHLHEARQGQVLRPVRQARPPVQAEELPQPLQPRPRRPRRARAAGGPEGRPGRHEGDPRRRQGRPPGHGQAAAPAAPARDRRL